MILAFGGWRARRELHLRGAYPSHGKPDADEVKERVGMEMCDVFWNMCDLANLLGLDLEQCFTQKMDVNKQRNL